MTAAARVFPVTVESVDTKAFASAIDWPGWSRSGKREQQALEALVAHAGRYAAIARRAGLDFPDVGDTRGPGCGGAGRG